MKPLTVDAAARIMGKRPEAVRIGIRRGIYPFGVAFKPDPEQKNYSYTIYPEKFRELYGPTPQEDTAL